MSKFYGYNARCPICNERLYATETLDIMCPNNCNRAEAIYLCIKCKREFKEIPPQEIHECPVGWYHRFVKKTDIIERDIVN